LQRAKVLQYFEKPYNIRQRKSRENFGVLNNQESLHKDRRLQDGENLFLIPISGESDRAYFFGQFHGNNR
jgi:hypothetical protein